MSPAAKAINVVKDTPIAWINCSLSSPGEARLWDQSNGRNTRATNDPRQGDDGIRTRTPPPNSAIAKVSESAVSNRIPSKVPTQRAGPADEAAHDSAQDPTTRHLARVGCQCRRN